MSVEAEALPLAGSSRERWSDAGLRFLGQGGAQGGGHTLGQDAVQRGGAAGGRTHVDPVAGLSSAAVGSESVARAKWSAGYARRLMITDTVVVLGISVVMFAMEVGSFETASFRADLDLAARLLAPVAALVWLAALTLARTREPSILGNGAEEYKRVVQSTIGVFGLLALASAASGLFLPRHFILVVLPLGLTGLVAGRFLWRRWLHAQRRRGRCVSRVLAIGSVLTVRDLIADLHRAPLSGYDIVAVCLADADGRPEVDGIPVVGDLDQVADLAVEIDIDVVAVASTASFGTARVRRLGWDLESTSIDLVVAPALTNVAGPRVHAAPVSGLPLLYVARPTYRGANRALKRSMDVVVSGVALILLMPVLLGLGLAVKLSDGGPVFFRQERAGLNGKIFRMIKFRSMVVDAEAKLAELAQQQRDAGNTVMFKLKHDPRVTGVGRLLRRLSLDELPQLLNVLKGDMSLVGPRPPLQSEVELYGEDAKLRLLVKPGMTGLWQVSGRSNLSWEDSVRLDTYYVENWSITSDLVILFKTAKAVLSSSGAY